MRYEHELFKWMMNEGKSYGKRYKCWPTPKAFGFAVRLYVDGVLDRKRTKVLLEDMFCQAAANPELSVYLDRQKRIIPGGSDD